MKKPEVSVLLSVYNGEHHIKSAIDSVLSQTFNNFELVIVDDGSTDKTSHIIEGYNNDRIVLIKNANNLGLVKSLNKALSVAKGKYIARMDADDISSPDRLEKQHDFLGKNPFVGIVGSWMNQVDINGKLLSVAHSPEKNPIIFWNFFFGFPIFHATIMARKKVFIDAGGYDSKFSHAEDVELWSRLLLRTEFSNIQESLYVRRLVDDSVSNINAGIQHRLGIVIRQNLIKRILNVSPPSKIVEWLFNKGVALSKDESQECISLIERIYKALHDIIKIDPESEEFIRRDLLGKMALARESSKNTIIRMMINFIRLKIPMSLRHRLKISRFGRFISEKVFKNYI